MMKDLPVLEAAIVLIAFVVVAAVFSYVVLGAGFFTTQKAQETIYKGLEQSTSNIQLIGNVYGLSNDTTKGISEIRFSVGLGPGASSVDLSKFTVIFSTPTTSPISLTWTSGTASQGRFTTKINGVGSSVSSLDVNQQVEFDFLTEYVPANSRMNIESASLCRCVIAVLQGNTCHHRKHQSSLLISFLPRHHHRKWTLI